MQGISKKVFFIIGSARSGTTAITRILDIAENASVTIESDPKLCVGARCKYESTLPYPDEFIVKSTQSKIEQALTMYEMHGDKNPNYLFFTDELHLSYRCKFLFVVRDGRDVVRSCMNFDKIRARTYDRYEDDCESMVTQPEHDFWDYGRLRPRIDDADFAQWRRYTKFEKYCWYWANYNRILLEKSAALPDAQYRMLDMSHVTPDVIADAFDFLGLRGFEQGEVATMLKSRINTTEIERCESFPSWQYWSEEQRQTFSKHADDMMIRMGYQ